MDDNDLVDVNLMALDLNQEPTDPPPLQRVERYGSWLNELESANDRIEERIRRLEAVTARARQRQRWREARNSMEIRDVVVPGELMVDLGGRSGNESSVERIGERGKGCKRDSSHLVAKALQLEAVKMPASKEGGSFYDCNICLDVARHPILTCCGHLFCWPCFYQVSPIDSNSKECPVCKGEVSDSTVIPIYGNGDGEAINETETGLKIPPRPKACRVESVRQQRVAQGLSHVPVAEALRRIRISIGAMGNQAWQEDRGGIPNLGTASEGVNEELGGGHRLRIHQVSRVLSESVASLSSLTSALSNAERLVEDLETVINSRLLQNSGRALQVDSNQAPPELTGAVVGSSSSSSSQPTEIPVGVGRTRSNGGARRRSIMSRILEFDNRDARETRRRRLN
ncbi:uncharacterized protein LOC127246492 [Andrographis paniculata]|uniref:uncharacterized protein LOC127246492 n=1 Tax=Andrographis paniculata TaxID=175694 RepID=UPI0021E7B9A6|nr:uncharacterized protein LOC127246492 [Andrographis paniculata]